MSGEGPHSTANLDEGPELLIEDDDQVEVQTGSMAGKYYAAGLSALDEGDVKEARRWLKLAHESEPDNAEYASAFKRAEAAGQEAINAWRSSRAQARKAELEAAGDAPGAATGSHSAPQARAISLPMAAAITLGIVVAAGLMLSDPGQDKHPNHAQNFQSVAPFTSLVDAPGGGWVGRIHEDWSELPEPEKLERCSLIAEQLPPTNSGVMVLQTADGGSTVCQQVSSFPPGPEGLPGSPEALAAEAAEADTPEADTPEAGTEDAGTEDLAEEPVED